MAAASQMDFLAQMAKWASLTANRPSLQTWLARRKARESFQATARERIAALAKAT
ncbi:MAG TPA: hypothetical protein VHV80_13535 [Steroidobacteraceae bacterium]|jgi:hypothetical protein|nr:hypothetical protein [Steroidobacteraceae bacterium]